MTLYPSDRHISRCSECGGWQWMDWCHTCEGTAIPTSDKEAA